MTQKIKIEIGATTGYVGATIERVIEFEKEYWDSLSDSEKNAEVLENLESMGLSWWWREVGEDDE